MPNTVKEIKTSAKPCARLSVKIRKYRPNNAPSGGQITENENPHASVLLFLKSVNWWANCVQRVSRSDVLRRTILPLQCGQFIIWPIPSCGNSIPPPHNAQHVLIYSSAIIGSEVGKGKRRATGTPAQRVTTPWSRCTQPHARWGRDGGKRYSRGKCRNFCALLTANAKSTRFYASSGGLSRLKWRVSIRLFFSVFGHNRGFDRRLRRCDRRLLQNGHNAGSCVGIILGMLPGIATGRRIGIDQFKDFNKAVPNCFASKLLLNANRIAVVGLAVMQAFNRLFEQLNVIHSPILSPQNQ